MSALVGARRALRSMAKVLCDDEYARRREAKNRRWIARRQFTKGRQSMSAPPTRTTRRDSGATYLMDR
jgi:hypothetical protein